MNVIEQLCVLAVIAVLASTSLPVLARTYRVARWKIEVLGNFHAGQLNRALQDGDGPLNLWTGGDPSADTFRRYQFAP